jgi:hypothetical protein
MNNTIALYQIIALEEYIEGKPTGNISFSNAFPVYNPETGKEFNCLH